MTITTLDSDLKKLEIHITALNINFNSRVKIHIEKLFLIDQRVLSRSDLLIVSITYFFT